MFHISFHQWIALGTCTIEAEHLYKSTSDEKVFLYTPISLLIEMWCWILVIYRFLISNWIWTLIERECHLPCCLLQSLLAHFSLVSPYSFEWTSSFEWEKLKCFRTLSQRAKNQSIVSILTEESRSIRTRRLDSIILYSPITSFRTLLWTKRCSSLSRLQGFYTEYLRLLCPVRQVIRLAFGLSRGHNTLTSKNSSDF